MKYWRTNRIARKYILWVLLFSSAITLLLTAIQLRLDYSHDIDQLKSRVAQIENSHLKGLALALWNMDDQGLKTQLSGILEIQDIEQLRITENTTEDASLQKAVEAVGEQRSKKVLINTFPLSHRHNGRRIDLGELTIIASLDNIYQRLLNKVFVLIVSNSIKTFLVSLFMFVVFQVLIGRHLSRIAQYADDVEAGRSDQSLALPGKSPGKHMPLSTRKSTREAGDELDQLVNAITQMRLRLCDFVQHEKLAAIGKLATQVVHDLRSPLSSLQVVVQGLTARLTGNATEGRYLTLLQMSTARLGTIAEDLLQRHQGAVERTTLFSLHQVLDELIGEYQHRADARYLTVVKQYHDRALAVHGNRTKLQRAVDNIMKNAIEAMGGQGCLTVMTGHTKAHVTLAIADTGPGMPPALLTKVLQGGHTEGKLDGHGIGMQVVRDTVTAFGGRLEGASVPGSGTTFRLFLPLPTHQQDNHGERDALLALNELIIPVRTGDPVIIVGPHAPAAPRR
ncbi:MAG: hypothetical protein HYV02_05075 [Deltaproteobacteria bacterium]|nr:hypothetical protein [Deltaproteobacteria bacterium]